MLDKKTFYLMIHRSNILLGREDISVKKIWDILKIVEAYEFVNNFEKKLDTSVEREVLNVWWTKTKNIHC